MYSVPALPACLLLALAHLCYARLGTAVYPIKQRKLETTIITESDLQAFMLTFSFDSPPKQLERFLIEIKTTDGDLPISSLGIVEVAMSQFVQKLLTGQFQQLNEIKLVETTITSQNALENFDGSTLEADVAVTFRNEPSPKDELVDSKLKSLMTDQSMLDFITILRDLATLNQDPELLNVTSVYRKAYPESGVDGMTRGNNGEDAVLAGQIRIVVPAIIATCLLLAGITLLVSKMKKREEDTEGISEIRKVNLMVDDDESDIFSFEAGLSPPQSFDAVNSETANYAETSNNKNMDDDDSLIKSPGGRSLRTLFSGAFSDNNSLGDLKSFTRKSLSKRSKSRPRSTRANNRLSPLLAAYSDDEEEDLLSSSESGSENMPESPSQSQPYDSIPLDELLVEKYSNNGDIDMVSPVHGISRRTNGVGNPASLEVYIDQNQRTIIGTAASVPVTGKSIHGESPKMSSPIVANKPPRYKASPNAKAPAATACASPQKPATANSVFEGFPDLWAKSASPSSSGPPNQSTTVESMFCGFTSSTVVSDCCRPAIENVKDSPKRQRTFERLPAVDYRTRQTKYIDNIPHGITAPPKVKRSVPGLYSQAGRNSNIGVDETSPRTDARLKPSEDRDGIDQQPSVSYERSTDSEESNHSANETSPNSNKAVAQTPTHRARTEKSHVSLRLAQSMSPSMRRGGGTRLSEASQETKRSARSMSPTSRQNGQDPASSISVWGKKAIITSPWSTKLADVESSDHDGLGKLIARKSSTVTTHSVPTVKAGYGSPKNSAKHQTNISVENDPSDPWTDASKRHPGDPWNNTSPSNTDPWNENITVRIPKSASPRYARRQSTQIATESGDQRQVKSESPPSRERRSGKQPPPEIWKQPLFSQEKLSRDIQAAAGAQIAPVDRYEIPKFRSQDGEPGDALLPGRDFDEESPIMHKVELELDDPSPSDHSAINTVKQRWSIQSVLNSAAKAASSVLSLGDSKFVDGGSNGAESQAVILRHVLPGDRSDRRLSAVSPESVYMAATNSLRRTRTANLVNRNPRSSSPGWLSRARAGLKRSSPSMSSRSPMHDKAAQDKVATKRLRTSFDEGEARQSTRQRARQGSPTGRRHSSYSAADGSTDYQAMLQRRDANLSSFDAVSLCDSTESGPTRYFRTPPSMNVSYLPSSSSSEDGSALDSRDGQKLLMDLEWLEKKIADQKSNIENRPSSPSSDYSVEGVSETSQSQNYQSLSQHDSMSFVSGDVNVESETESSVDGKPDVGPISTIVCRDVYAPPGKLGIIIHSTKDGPAVHTVKRGSLIQGHIFPGDLIVSVDDIDTRTFTAEQVMRMMASLEMEERKITVLHFERETPASGPPKRLRKS